MNTTGFTAATAILALAAAAAQQAKAANVELTLSHWVPAVHALQPTGMEPWAQSIRDASDGRIEITIYPSSQLGNAADHYDMARDGIVDIAFINPGYQPGRFPIVSAAEIPFTIANATGGSRALDEWYRPYAEQEMGDVYYCMAHLHDPGTLHGARGPIQKPADLNGKTIRPAHGTMGRFVSSLGASSVQVPAGESRDLVARGAADMTAGPWNSVYLFGMEDITKHHLDLPFYTTTFAFVMNKALVEGLAPEDRQVIDDHCTPEWAERMATGWAEHEAAGRQLLIDDGHTLYAPMPDEVEAWKEAAAPLQAEWKQAVAARGVDADAAWDDLMETLGKYEARLD